MDQGEKDGMLLLLFTASSLPFLVENSRGKKKMRGRFDRFAKLYVGFRIILRSPKIFDFGFFLIKIRRRRREGFYRTIRAKLN
jgi:hypothetical protein